jgi:Ankyrin repeat
LPESLSPRKMPGNLSVSLATSRARHLWPTASDAATTASSRSYTSRSAQPAQTPGESGVPTPEWEFALKGLDQESGAQADKMMWQVESEPFTVPLRKPMRRAGSRRRLSDMVRRILRSAYAVGIDKWGPALKVDMARHNAIALEIARQGIVLLKNDGALPLATDKPLKIAVIGGYAQEGVGKPGRARRRLKTLKELLRLGANPNIGEFQGDTPLHTALKKGYDVEIFKLLLKCGANPDAPGKDGRSVREIASRKRDKRYLEALGR